MWASGELEKQTRQAVAPAEWPQRVFHAIFQRRRAQQDPSVQCGWLVVSEFPQPDRMLNHFDHLIKDVGPALGHEPGIWPKHHLPSAVIHSAKVLMNALHDRAVLRSKSKALFGGGTFAMQYRVRITLGGQTVPKAHQDRFWTVVT